MVSCLEGNLVLVGDVVRQWWPSNQVERTWWLTIVWQLSFLTHLSMLVRDMDMYLASVVIYPASVVIYLPGVTPASTQRLVSVCEHLVVITVLSVMTGPSRTFVTQLACEQTKSLVAIVRSLLQPAASDPRHLILQISANSPHAEC